MKHFGRKNKANNGLELELLERWIDELREESLTKPVVVEGKKDSEALKKFGILTDQLHKTHRSLNERVEMLAQNKECILLMDLDKAGRRLHAHMKGDLQHAGVRVNSRFRNFLLTRTRLRFIEGLDTYMKNLGFR